MLKRAARVVRRINVDALDLSSKLLFQSLECQQVVTENKPIIEQVLVGYTVWRMAGLLRILQQNPRVQLRPILLAYPGELEFGFRGIAQCSCDGILANIHLNTYTGGFFSRLQQVRSRCLIHVFFPAVSANLRGNSFHYKCRAVPLKRHRRRA
jgi:hypothetical protein